VERRHEWLNVEHGGRVERGLHMFECRLERVLDGSDGGDDRRRVLGRELAQRLLRRDKDPLDLLVLPDDRLRERRATAHRRRARFGTGRADRERPAERDKDREHSKGTTHPGKRIRGAVAITKWAATLGRSMVTRTGPAGRAAARPDHVGPAAPALPYQPAL